MARIVAMLLAGLIVGCNLGNPSTPAQIPAGLLQGRIVNGGPVAGATITITDDGVPIAQTRSDDSGAFAVTIRAPTGLLTITAQGGSFTEQVGSAQTSGTLKALIHYRQGIGGRVAITPFTTMAATLAVFLARGGMTLTTAATLANTRFQQWLGIAVTRTIPQPLDSTAIAAAWTPALRYGLATAALSVWATNTLSSSTPVVILALDASLAHDGSLDGIGAAGPVMVGNTTLTPDVIREGLGLAVMAIAGSPTTFHNSSDATLTGPLDAQIQALAHAVATVHAGLFDNAAPPPFGWPPLTVTLSSLPVWTHGTLMVGGTIADPFALPVTSVLSIGSSRAQMRSTDGALSFSINTQSFADGRYALVVTASDGAGETASAHAVVGFDNTPPWACFGTYTGPFRAGVASGLWIDTAGVVSATFNGVPATVGAGTWQAQTSGTALDPLTLVLTDAAGNQSVFRWRVTQQGTAAQCP